MSETQEVERAETAPEENSAVSFAIQQQHLTEFVANARTILNEAKVHIREDGLFLRGVEPANVGMISQTLAKEAFESYHAPSDDAVLGLNLERVADVLGMGVKGDIVRADLDSETRKLHWSVDRLEYTQALIDPDSIRQEPDIPDLDLTAIFELPGSEISRAVKAADMVSDHIRFEFDEDSGGAVIEADGDTDSVEVIVTPDRGLEVVESGPGDSLFSIDYLGDIESAFPSNEFVRVELGEEFPAKFHYEFGAGYGEATNMLAPRVSNQ
jgi:proliferating cell nuclear antigen